MRKISMPTLVGPMFAALMLASQLTFAAPPAKVSEQDAAGWYQMQSNRLSPNGQWLIYLLGPAPGVPNPRSEGVVVVRSTSGSTERRYNVGNVRLGAGNVQMSPSGKWIAFQSATGVNSGALSNGLKVILVRLDDGATHEFPARNFEFAGGPSEKLVLQSYPTGNDPSFSLTIRSLEQGATEIRNVTAFTIDPLGARMAWIDGHSLRIQEFVSGHIQTLIEKLDGNYGSFTWSERGKALALLRENDAGRAYILFTGLDRPAPKKTVFLPKDAIGFPQGYSLTASLRWRADETGVFFQIQPSKPTESWDTPNLAIWNWRDETSPDRRQYSAGEASKRWGFLSLKSKRYVKLSDDTLENIEPQARGRYVLGYDLRAYGAFNKAKHGTAADQRRDYYLVDLDRGGRELLVRGLNVITRDGLSIRPQLSPDGFFALYQDNAGDYIAYEIRTNTRRNLTAALPTKFYFPENDPKSGWQMRDAFGQGVSALQGWSIDGAYVLISDYYDVWALPLRNGTALNLTGNGRRDDISYKRIVLEDSVEERIFNSNRSPVDLGAPLYFYAFDFKTAKTGLMRRAPRQRNLEALRWEYAATSYHKARDADVYLYSRTTLTQSGDWFRLSRDWQPEAQLTDINPQQRQFQWAAGARYLTYRNSRGETRHAALRLPAGYVEGHAYPTVVEIYREFSGGVHNYYAPLTSENSWLFLHNGYAVLQPDILPRLNEAGDAALDDVTAGVEAAVAVGVADRTRLGLFGHSFGGYETALLVSKSNIFKAAVDYAGVANLWSQCGAPVRGGFDLCERDQTYLAGPWWDDWDAYLNNSPLYNARSINTPLLLAHGDKDASVPFSQSVELFNTLRRLSKPVTLLQYKNEPHSFTDDAQRDFYRRRLEFFDHYLKGMPAPQWLIQ